MKRVITSIVMAGIGALMAPPLVAQDISYGTPEWETYVWNGGSATKVDLVILSEG